MSHTADSEDLRATKQRLAQLQQIRETWAAYIIAKGVLLQGESEAIMHIADKMFRVRALRDEFAALGKRLVQAGVDDSIRTPVDGDPAYRQGIDDATLHYALEWAEAGYLLGLAVGMQLGPHAFDAASKGGAQ